MLQKVTSKFDKAQIACNDRQHRCTLANFPCRAQQYLVLNFQVHLNKPKKGRKDRQEVLPAPDLMFSDKE